MMPMKKKTSLWITVIILITTGIVLTGINRDLFQFSYELWPDLYFTPETSDGNDHKIGAPVALKPGQYELSLDISVTGGGSTFCLLDGEGTELFSLALTEDTDNTAYPFEISGTAKQVQPVIRYDTENSTVRLDRVRITADHVLYRESLFRHIVISAVIFLIALWLIFRVCFPDRLWKLFPAFSVPHNERELLLIIGLTLISCIPLLFPHTYTRGEDMFFHLTRIRGLAESLKAGYFPVRDQLYWIHNYGYGVGFYYPDVFLYFPAVLLLLGFELLTAYKIFLITFTFLSIASAWFAGYRITKNRTSAAAAAVFAAFFSYRLSNIYYRGAVGETQAAAFYPLIILGLYEIFFRDREKWPYFAFGFLGLLFSHAISLVIAVVLTLIFLITQLRKIIKDPSLLIPLIKSIILAAGIGAFFWMPMFEQTLTNPGLRINKILDGTVRLNRANYAFPVRNIFSFFKPWDFARQAESIYPGWSLLLVPVLRLGIWKKQSRLIKAADYLLVYGSVVIFMCTQAFPWHLAIFLPFVTRIQFAYRMLLPAGIMLCIAGCIYFSEFTGRKNKILWGTVLALFCFFSTAFPVLRETINHRTIDKRVFIMQDNRISGGEYLPYGLPYDYPERNADTVHLAEGDEHLAVTAHKRNKLGFIFSYEITPDLTGEVHLSVPLLYYTGYQGKLTSEDGTTLIPEIIPDEQGLVSLSNMGIPRGTISVSYQKTTVQRISEALTLLSIGLLFIQRKKRSVYSRSAEF